MGEKRQLHLIAEDLGEGAVEDWAAEGVRMLAGYLAKHADFLRFLEAGETGADSSQHNE